MIAVLCAVAAVTVPTNVLACWLWALAAATAGTAVQPFPLAALPPRARKARALIAGRWIRQGVAVYLALAARVVGVALLVLAAVVGVLAAVDATGGPGPSVRWVVVGAGLAVVVGTTLAFLGIAVLLTLSDQRRSRIALPGRLVRLLPFDPSAFLIDPCRPQFAALEDCVRTAQKQAQQAELDRIARETRIALPYVLDLEPEALRLRVERQLALWPPSGGTDGALGGLACREAMALIDGHLEQLEQDVADGMPPDSARALWYTVILRSVRQLGGPRALPGALAGLSRTSVVPEPVDSLTVSTPAVSPVAAPDAAAGPHRVHARRATAGRNELRPAPEPAEASPTTEALPVIAALTAAEDPAGSKDPAAAGDQAASGDQAAAGATAEEPLPAGETLPAEQPQPVVIDLTAAPDSRAVAEALPAAEVLPAGPNRRSARSRRAAAAPDPQRRPRGGARRARPHR